MSHLPWLKASQLGSWQCCSLQLHTPLGLLYHLFPHLSVPGSIILITLFLGAPAPSTCIAQKSSAESTALFWTTLDTNEEAGMKQ